MRGTDPQARLEATEEAHNTEKAAERQGGERLGQRRSGRFDHDIDAAPARGGAHVMLPIRRAAVVDGAIGAKGLHARKLFIR